MAGGSPTAAVLGRAPPFASLGARFFLCSSANCAACECAHNYSNHTANNLLLLLLFFGLLLLRPVRRQLRLLLLLLPICVQLGLLCLPLPCTTSTRAYTRSSMIARLFPICIIFEFLVCELYCASVSAICLLLLSRS